MNRRTFLAWAAVVAVWASTGIPQLRLNAAAAPIDRKTAWAPNPRPLLLTEWRYVAGRIAGAGSDYGFVVSLSDTRLPQQTYDLLVERQDFMGSKSFAAKSYTGTRAYNSATGTYTFQAAQSQVSATWQWDDAARIYRLTVTSPELSLLNVALRPRDPQGSLIPEGGDGAIGVGEVMGVQLGSDYYADWTQIEIGGAAKGFARLDMQGLYPATTYTSPLCSLRFGVLTRPAQAGADYDHHWFAIAGQSDGQPVWISAWRIETQNGPLWDVTIARGSGGTWTVSSTTEESAGAVPLEVQPTDGQPLPAPDGPAQGTGMAWHLTAGASAPGDLIDLRVAVPPGQFATSARLGEGLSWIEEGVGSTTASGTVLGKPLNGVVLVVAETTFEFGLRLQYLPLVRR
jgi:hypothetical protein